MKEIITKEKLKIDLEKANAVIDRWAEKDKRLRQEFSNLLNDSPRERDYYGRFEKEAKLMSWEEIFFKMGELKSDADYSLCISAREELKRENQELQEQVNNFHEEFRKYEKH